VRPGPVGGATLYWTWPLPLPAAPDTIVSHWSLLAAVHAQPALTLTEMLPVPPLAAIDAVSGEIENAHPATA
jgi:hypothetical protein